MLGTPPEELAVPNAEANAGPTALTLPRPLDNVMSSDVEEVRIGAPVCESLIDVGGTFGPLGPPWPPTGAPAAATNPPLPQTPRVTGTENSDDGPASSSSKRSWKTRMGNIHDGIHTNN